MKKILFAKGGSQYGTLRVYSDMVIEELRKRGYDVNIIDRNKEGEWDRIDEIIDDTYDIVMSIQMTAFKAKAILEKHGKVFKNLKYICICGDHPIYINYWLKSVKGSDNAYLILGDAQHYDYVKEYYPWVKIGLLNTTIGNAVLNHKKFDERETDVFFGGTYYDLENELNDIASKDKPLAMEIIDTILKNEGMTLERAAKIVLDKHNIILSKEEFVDYLETLIPVDRYVRGYYRNLFIEAFTKKKITVSIYGNGWDESIFADNKYIRIIKGVSTLEKGFEYMADSKIILNIMPWSRVGLHDRIANAMLTGAVCVTNGNKKIDSMFKNNIDILSYSLEQSEQMAEEVEELLRDVKRGQKISMNGMEKANAMFTCSNYTDNILDIISEMTKDTRGVFEGAKIRRTTMVITQRCTLKCKLCLAFIPYYERPVDMSYEDAATVIDNYFKIVASVQTFSVTGGEPLMNKNIVGIMNKVYEYSDKIEQNIDIVTNGTLLISEELLRTLSKHADKTRVIISNYGDDLSIKCKQLIADLEKWKINYRVQNYAGNENWLYDGWVDFSDHSLKHETKEKEIAQARRCIFRQGHYYVINDGELHPCSRSYWRMRTGIIPRDDKQYINLLERDNFNPFAEKERLAEMEELISLNSCAYCNGVHKGVKRYKPAEQLK